MPLPCPRSRCFKVALTSELGAMMAEPGFSAAPLAAPVAAIAAEFPALSAVVAVTTNPCAVMTEIGAYAPPCFAGDGLCLGQSGTGLRIHCGSVATALAVERPDHGQVPCSLQFFDGAGAALHKCFLTSVVDDFAFADLTRDWIGSPPAESAADPAAGMPAMAGMMPAQPDGAWWRWRDGAFQVDGVLRDNGLARRASLPSWGEDLAWRIDPDILFDLMTLLSEVRMPVSIGVGNAAFVQMHQGAIDKAMRGGNMIRLTTGACSVSLDLEEIEEIWVTCFDAGGRTGHMLELYDWRYHCVAQFSEFSPDNSHLARYWHDTLRALPRLKRRDAMRGARR